MSVTTNHRLPMGYQPFLTPEDMGTLLAVVGLAATRSKLSERLALEAEILYRKLTKVEATRKGTR